MFDPELMAKVNLVVGEQLSLERRAAGLTCLELDQAADLLPGTVLDSERGGKLSVRSLDAICLVLGLDTGEFLDAAQREVKARGI